MINLGLGLGLSRRAAVDLNWSEAAFPAALMQPSVQGYVYDPTHPSNTVGNDGSGGAPALGGTVGRVQGYSPDLADQNLAQPSDALRPTYALRGGKPCFVFNGTDQYLANASQASGNWTTPPKTLTMYAMLWRDTDAPASEEAPFSISRGEVSTSFTRLALISAANGMRASCRMGGTTFVNNLTAMASFPVGTWVEVIAEMAVTEMSVDSVGTQSGTLRYWINDMPVVTHNILPDRGSAANITQQTYFTLGARHASITPGLFWNGAVGRAGWMNRGLNDTERAQVRNWMRGTTYIAP